MRRLFFMVVFFPIILGTVRMLGDEGALPQPLLVNPYERFDNGPPLTNIFHKAKRSWIYLKLRRPKHHPAARMPAFQFTEEEALEIMAYLKSIAAPKPPSVLSWPGWAEKSFEELDDDEFEVVFDLIDRGSRVWSNARCSICHSINGPGGELIGGFVDLRVGGIDLQIAGAKLKRDWLFSWIKDPKAYFPETLMPRFRFSDEEIRALLEYILRDDAFIPPAEEKAEELSGGWKGLDDPKRIAQGKQLIQIARCVACHDIKGITDLHRHPVFHPPSEKNSMEYLAYDVRCLSCHAMKGRGGTYAPDLSNEGSRLQEDWIAQFLESPDMIRPLSQQMPKFNLTREEARGIAAYMHRNRRDEGIPETIPGGPLEEKEIQRGEDLYKTKGCFSCHLAGDGPGGSVGPSLKEASDRLQPGYIWYHLKNPHAANPYSVEPDYGLSDEEARILAAWLSSLRK